MAKERACMICGRRYKFCHHCKEFEQEPKWKYLYHDEKCKQIGDLWYAYRGGEISKDAAKKALSKLTPNINAALKYTGTAASNEIREIFDVDKEQPIVEQSAEEAVVEKQSTSPKKRNSKKDSQEAE